MGTVRKTISLTTTQGSWIKPHVDAGHYTNDSEYIRDLIRREQHRHVETEAIRAPLVGETIGEASPFDAHAFKQRMLRAHGQMPPNATST